MKKLLICAILVSTLVLTGCEKVEEQGKYKEGTYYGSATDNYGGETNTATAVIYVDENGWIKSIFVDTTYTKDEKVTTKKTLGTEYGMSTIMNTKEWDEQVKLLEDKIIEEQGLDWLKWTDAEKTTTDSVSGVTIKINAMYEAISNALNQAK